MNRKEWLPRAGENQHDETPRCDAQTVASIRNLRVITSPGAPIIEDVSLELAQGEVLGIVGESGSGKTTTARALLGYSAPGTAIAAGEINIAGRQIIGFSDRTLRPIRGRVVSYVPQNPGRSLNPSMRIGSIVKAMLREHDQSGNVEERTRVALATAALPSDEEFTNRYPHELSGGQQQRTCLAVALSCQPSIVVLDEPTTGLDVITQAHILEELGALRRDRSMAMVYVSHDLAVVARLADRVAVMYAGRIIELGPTRQVLHNPRHPYTRGLLSSIPDHLSPRALRAMPGIAVGLHDRPRGCAFSPRCPLRIDQCDEAVPNLHAVGSAHLARCIRTDDVADFEQGPRIGLPGNSRAVPAQHDAAPPILQISNLTATYRRRRQTVVAAEGVSFEVAQGECVALVGESGSGKTTIARVIAGLHQPAGGEMRVHGNTLRDLAQNRSTEDRRRIQIIFQNPADAFNPRHTVGRAVARPARFLRGLSRAEADAEVDRLLELVRLPTSYARQYPRQLSGGELQRVGIARALAAKPDILICDEITSSLDVSVQAAVLELLASLRATIKMSMLFITHDLGVVANIADRVLVLERGKIREQGAVATVIGAPKHPYTIQLIDAAPSLSATRR